jgi:hypothetical protein
MPIKPRQANRAAVDQRNADAAAEHAKHRVVLDDSQIAQGGQLQAARDRIARNRRD